MAEDHELIERRLAVPLYQRALRPCPEVCARAHIMLGCVRALASVAEEQDISNESLVAAGFDLEHLLEQALRLGRTMPEPENAKDCKAAVAIALKALASLDRGNGHDRDATQKLEEAAALWEAIGEEKRAQSIREDLRDISQGVISSSRLR